jgi:hypothetical protein
MEALTIPGEKECFDWLLVFATDLEHRLAIMVVGKEWRDNNIL